MKKIIYLLLFAFLCTGPAMFPIFADDDTEEIEDDDEDECWPDDECESEENEEE